MLVKDCEPVQTLPDQMLRPAAHLKKNEKPETSKMPIPAIQFALAILVTMSHTTAFQISSSSLLKLCTVSRQSCDAAFQGTRILTQVSAADFSSSRIRIQGLRSSVMSGPLSNDLIIRAAKGEPVERTPIWLFRQAGFDGSRLSNIPLFS